MHIIRVAANIRSRRFCRLCVLPLPIVDFFSVMFLLHRKLFLSLGGRSHAALFVLPLTMMRIETDHFDGGGVIVDGTGLFIALLFTFVRTSSVIDGVLDFLLLATAFVVPVVVESLNVGDD